MVSPVANCCGCNGLRVERGPLLNGGSHLLRSVFQAVFQRHQHLHCDSAIIGRCFLCDERSRSLGLRFVEKSGGSERCARSLNDCIIVKKGAASLGFSCVTATKRPTARHASFAPSRPPSPSFSKVSEAYQSDSSNSREAALWPLNGGAPAGGSGITCRYQSLGVAAKCRPSGSRP